MNIKHNINIPYCTRICKLANQHNIIIKVVSNKKLIEMPSTPTTNSILNFLISMYRFTNWKPSFVLSKWASTCNAKTIGAINSKPLKARQRSILYFIKYRKIWVYTQYRPSNVQYKKINIALNIYTTPRYAIKYIKRICIFS